MINKKNLNNILNKYKLSFCDKNYSQENNQSDLLMEVFGISSTLKRENRQYWGRELGKCWESLVKEACKNSSHYSPALKIGNDEPCDLIVKNYAIDTKYRLGSGDSGTLKKFKQYGSLLKKKGYKPVFIFLRSDNLPAAITACKIGGWDVYIGEDSFKFIKEISDFDLKNYLKEKKNLFTIKRN